MRKLACLILLVALGASACAAVPSNMPPTPGDTPGPTGTAGTTPPGPTLAAGATFDPALASTLQAELDDSVTVLGYPALAAAVILPDGSSWSGAAGMADVANAIPATPDTAFAVASITKTFVAGLMLMLAHDGILSLDDPLARWLPELAGDARFRADRVTVRQLLDHTSGIAEYRDDPSCTAIFEAHAARAWTPQDVISCVGSPTFAPGADWSYSNTNYILAGMVVERATGSTVASQMRLRIFTPLGLARTVLQPEERPGSPVAHAYSAWVPTGTPEAPADPWDGTGLTPNAALSAAAWTAGGIASTVPDIARWAAALYGGRVLDPASLREMLDFERIAGLPSGGTYGLGVMRWLEEGGLAIGHAGGQVGFQSLMWYLTKQGATLVVLTNTDARPLDPVSQSLQRIVLEHLAA